MVLFVHLPPQSADHSLRGFLSYTPFSCIQVNCMILLWPYKITIWVIHNVKSFKLVAFQTKTELRPLVKNLYNIQRVNCDGDWVLSVMLEPWLGEKRLDYEALNSFPLNVNSNSADDKVQRNKWQRLKSLVPYMK